MLSRYVNYGIIFYVCVFILKQIVFFFITLMRLRGVRELMLKKIAKCERDGETMQLFPGECTEANQIAEKDPIAESFMAVFGETYSCGFVSCTSTILSILETKAGLVFMFCMACLVFFFLFQWWEDRKERRYSDQTFLTKKKKPKGLVTFNIEEVNKGGQRMHLVTTDDSAAYASISDGKDSSFGGSGLNKRAIQYGMS